MFSSVVMLIVCVIISNTLRHVIAGLIKLWKPSIGIKRDYTFQPTVSILLPCYNEGKAVYDTVGSICKSNYPHDKFEVIAIDDCSVDDSYQWLLKAQKDFTNIHIRVGKNHSNSGKARTVCNALKQSQAEIILSIDSDCLFDPNAISELTACFTDPKIGAVGGAVGIKNVNQNAITAVQTFVYYVNFRLMKILENVTQTVICISGCMFAIRRDLFLKLEPKVRGRKWFGIEVNDGEDRFLTHQVMLSGYGTIINPDAQCWTTVPDNLSQLFKQQVRWQRSGVRDFFFTLRHLKEHVWKLNPNALYGLVVPSLVVIAYIGIIFLFPIAYAPLWVAPSLVLLYLAGAIVFDPIVKKFNPEQRISNLYTVPLFALWVVAGRLVEIVALFTLDSRDWGTRAKEEIAESETGLDYIEGD